MRTIARAALAGWFAAAVLGCRTDGGARVAEPKGDARYRVQRVDRPVAIDGSWDKAPWSDIEPLSLGFFMGEEPAHRPRTQAKVAYDDENLYVIFRVEDRFVRSVTTELHGPVYTDSCVEFFFVPGPATTEGYLNLEVNCGGTMLFNHQLARGEKIVRVTADDCAQIELAHSMPARVEPEIAEPIVWTVEYRLPLAVIGRYHPIVRPAPGAVWRANFYKCADATSHPHWLTWALVRKSVPDFHRPECFGTLEFE